MVKRAPKKGEKRMRIVFAWWPIVCDGYRVWWDYVRIHETYSYDAHSGGCWMRDKIVIYHEPEPPVHG